MTPSVLELGTHSPIWYQEASMLKRTLNFIATDPRSSSLEETAHEYGVSISATIRPLRVVLASAWI